MCPITFVLESATPVTIDTNANENLLDLARKANVAIDAPCSGNGACGKCRVRLWKGYLDSPQNRHISSEEYEAGWRNQLIKAPLMRMVDREPNATYVTINLGEVYIADEIREKSFGLDGRLDELLPALREAVYENS